ncbi:MAG: DUF2298 domain-containing protein [ANME-2 cluster archaeon]|nr:DUF2298 domain-containing protein [ANME-2 cluster archaeon]
MEWFEIIKWWMVLELIGLAAMPATAWIFRNLQDKGVTLSKILGLVMVTYLSWILTYLGFEYSAIIVGICVLMVFSLSMVIFVNRGFPFDQKTLIRSELLFTAAFLFFVILRAYRPEIYWTGGEKFMDMSFINIILRSTSFPPMDPWLSGEPMQYYYFGYLVAANLIKLSGVPAAIGFNLGVASMFALSATAAYGLGEHLTRSRIFGVVVMAFVVLFGNLAGFVQLLVIVSIPKYYGLFNVPAGNMLTRLSTYNYWPTSRVIPNTINEFPYFSFIQADLHAHMIAIAFQLLMIALLLNLLLQGKEYNKPALATVALLLGFMFPLNSWDYPTYAIFFVIIMLVWRIRISAKPGQQRSFVGRIMAPFPNDYASTLGMCAIVGISSIVLYLPYHVIASGVSHSIKQVTYGQTLLIFYLGVFGILLFFILVYTIDRFYDRFNPDMKLILSGLAIAALAAYHTHIQILVVVLPIIGMSVYNMVKEDAPDLQFVYVLIVLGALLSLFCELFYIQDSFGIQSPDYIRFNTVFKIYVQHWLVWALAAGVSFYHMWNRKGKLGKQSKALAILSVILILAALSYPVFATYSRSDNFKNRPTLDGSAYFAREYQNEYNAIMWLNTLNGTPVVLQSPGHTYSPNTHVTTFTGLPTVIGWAGHEKNWRNRAQTIDERWNEVPQVYMSGDLRTVKQVLDKYQVEYIYVGSVEEERYGGTDARKLFDKNPGTFELVYFNPNVHIYRVVR